MNIRTVYITSKGMFWCYSEAEKKSNRAKSYGSRPGDPDELELVREGFVLVEGGQVFSLSEVEVK